MAADLLRKWTPEQFKAEVASIRKMWQLAVVFELLDVFKNQLKLTIEITPAMLEEALVYSTGPGLLATLHIVSFHSSRCCPRAAPK